MKLYDKLVDELKLLLEPFSIHTYKINEKDENLFWEDVGNHHMILKNEMAYELGGGEYAAVSSVLYTSAPFLQDEICIIGPDLFQIQKDCSYARITLVQVSKDFDEGDYDSLKKIEYARFHVHPYGYMSRISSVGNREPVRIGKEAIKEGLDFKKTGKLLMDAYHKCPQVEHVRIIYITDPAFPYKELEKLTKKSEQITESLNQIFQNLSMDCGSCGLKSICDEVDGMRELHFAHSNG